MEALTYEPPLRAAILWCISLDRGPVPPETLAIVAGVDLARAKAFGSILLNLEVLAEESAGYVAGRRWTTWATRRSRARPHTAKSNSEARLAAVCAAEAEVARMRWALRDNVARLIEARGWSALELARRAGVRNQYLYDLIRHGDPLPAFALVLVARTLETPVEQLVAPFTAQLQNDQAAG